MITIDMKATGLNIKSIMKSKGMKVSEVQNTMGFNNPQSIFKWMRGDSMPTIDNMVILADLLGVTIDQIVVTTKM